MAAIERKERALSSYEHGSDIGRWRFYHRKAHPRLQPYVMGNSGSEGVVPPHGSHGLGSPSAELMISLDGWSEFRGLGEQDREAFRTSRPFVSGLRETSKRYRLESGFTGLQVDLTVLGAQRVIGAPMSLLTNHEVEAEAFFGHRIRTLQQALASETDWASRFEVLERFLGSRIESSASNSAEVLEGWTRIVRSRGRLSIDQLRRQLKLSHRRMISLFREEIGVTPKRLAELVRFDHAITLATGSMNPVWTSIAYEAGYYDQAHLINDFRRRMGITPSELRDRLRPKASMVGQNSLGALYSGGGAVASPGVDHRRR